MWKSANTSWYGQLWRLLWTEQNVYYIILANWARAIMYWLLRQTCTVLRVSSMPRWTQLQQSSWAALSRWRSSRICRTRDLSVIAVMATAAERSPASLLHGVLPYVISDIPSPSQSVNQSISQYNLRSFPDTVTEWSFGG